MRVKYEGKTYEFDPDKQGKPNLLNLIAENVPMPLKWKVWLTIQAIKMKGIMVEVDTEGGEV